MPSILEASETNIKDFYELKILLFLKLFLCIYYDSKTAYKMQNEGGIPPGYKNSIQNLKIQTYFVRKLVKKKKIYNYRHSSKRGNKNFKGKNHFFFSHGGEQK